MATTKSEKEDLNRAVKPEVKRETEGLGAGGLGAGEGAGWERTENVGSRNESEAGLTGGLSTIKGGKSRTMDDTRGNLAGKSSQVLEKAQTVVTDFARNAGDRVSQWGGNAKDIASQAGDNVATMVRRYPVASVFAGFGIGCLFGLLIPRRR